MAKVHETWLLEHEESEDWGPGKEPLRDGSVDPAWKGGA